MKRSIGLLLALLGAASVSCGSASSGGNTTAHVEQSGTAPSASSSPEPTASPTGAGTAEPAGTAATPAPQPSAGSSLPAATAPSAATRAPVATAPAATAPGTPAPAGWKLVVYYTAVESFHHGPLQRVTGCPLNGPDSCSNGTADLGSYPGDFIDRVKVEGTGRIDVNKAHKGQYLAYDAQDGFSLDTAATDVAGNPLKAFVSAAADDAVPMGTHFRVLDCGTDRTSGRPPAAADCARLSSPDWVVVDSSGQPAGSRELDLYVGEENQPDFENTVPYVMATVNARTTLR